MMFPEPITAYVGVNGSGKSLSAIAFAISDMNRRDRPLLTNMQGLSVEHVPVDSVEALPDLLNQTGTCNIVLDEAGVMFASRDTGRNKAFEKAVQQLRKNKARLLWTAPAFGRADKILREVTFAAILCKSLYSKGVTGDPWPSTRLIMQKKFDVSRLDNSGMSINKNAKAKGFGIVRTSQWEDAFDSWGLAATAPATPTPAEVTPLRPAGAHTKK